ncbi:vesicle coat protein [Microdochium trichocladiopsis]|uniref:Vesicle coat protein n=1 Tax=Microdochium trichocladiopsis TaxID=1682393 RepID=A0A9P8Y452_9PEZI|nr:vesicle coat protein [Microdochium trichocladiopsis]KAH7029237.1 vesicle coat protein [Microdochium trichocladiopsis]
MPWPQHTNTPADSFLLKLCLAHYCDSHGPTPLMVTEGLPVACSQCDDDNVDTMNRSYSGTIPTAQPSVNDAMRKLDLNGPRSSSAPSPHQENRSNTKHRNAKTSASPAAATVATEQTTILETPPQSPHRSSGGFQEGAGKANGLHRDSSFRRTYDDTVTRRANPCQNCALTLPKRQDGNNGEKSRSENAGPTLRTRAPYARVIGGGSRDISPPSSNPQSSTTSDVEDDVPSTNLHRPAHQRRPTTSTTRSSASSRSSHATHTHYLDYTSTHEPLISSTYSIVRASCLRTLSFETLPRRPDSSYSNAGPTSPVSTVPPLYSLPAGAYGSGYVTSAPTPQSAAAGGPIFFGDPLAGYTTAYIFRIPDVHARGRKRVYAFLALSTHRERLAMKTFSFISAAFRDLAAWIQDLAEMEAELEREREESRSGVAAINAAYGGSSGSGGFGSGGPHDSSLGLGGGLGGGVTITPDREASRNSDSSFLTGGSRGHGLVQRMGGSVGPGGFAPKARGLAELVGLPDFFIELHARFVKLLLELGVVLSS